MNIIYIERKDEPGKVSERTEIICGLLREEGHSVVHGRTIEDITGRSRDISEYDLAICHPDLIDSERLNEEMERRKSFKVILQSLEPDEYSLRAFREGQYYTIVYINPKRLLDVVRKIQKDLTGCK